MKDSIVSWLVIVKRAKKVLFLSFCALLLTSGCAHQPSPSASDPPGFWFGLLHGFLIVFSFIGSLFTDARIYAFPNSGRLYDLGFLIGAALFLGGAGASRREEDEDEEEEEEEESLETAEHDSAYEDY